MAIKGAEAKKEITNKILSTFSNSFLYNSGKEIRIPIMEDGQLIQIKCTLTAAKTNVENGEDVAIPGEVKVETAAVADPTPTPSGFMNEPTEEEKANIESLLESLGLK